MTEEYHPSKSFEYLTRNGDQIERFYGGKWIAIDGEVIVAADKSHTKVLKNSKKIGSSHALVTYVDPKDSFNAGGSGDIVK